MAFEDEKEGEMDGKKGWTNLTARKAPIELLALGVRVSGTSEVAVQSKSKRKRLPSLTRAAKTALRARRQTKAHRTKEGEKEIIISPTREDQGLLCVFLPFTTSR